MGAAKKASTTEERRQIQVNTGKVTYDLVDEYGDKFGEVRFNPADFGLWTRAEAFVEALNNIQVPEGDVTPAWFDETARYIEEQFDVLFNTNVSSDLFGKVFPFAMNEDGDFYFEECAIQMVGLIEELLGKRMDTKLKKLEGRQAVRKATSKYHK